MRGKIVIIGATGQLGQDLLRVFGEQAVGLSHQDVDVTNGVSLASTLRELEPDWVLNTAAFHRVDDCELNPSLAFAVNALGASNVARATADIGAGVVFFSTDYVFGGTTREREHPYTEDDSAAPLNVYGVSKLAGEQLAAQSNPRCLVLRSAGLYGAVTSRKGWTFPELMLRKAREEGIVSVVTDQALSPTFTADLAAKVRELIERNATGLFHLTNAGECSWFEFARRVFELAGVNVRLEPKETSQTPRSARRPSYSALSSVRLAEAGVSPLRAWDEALRNYLQIKGIIS